jgi:hypothetical protein
MTENDEDRRRSNEKIEDFLDRYCNKHGISVTEAMTHKLVQEVIKEYIKC